VRVVVVRGARALAGLGQEQVDAERRALVVQSGLDLVDLLAQHLRRIVQPAEHADAARVGHGSGEPRPGRLVHAGEHDRVLDAQKRRDRLRRKVSAGV